MDFENMMLVVRIACVLYMESSPEGFQEEAMEMGAVIQSRAQNATAWGVEGHEGIYATMLRGVCSDSRQFNCLERTDMDPASWDIQKYQFCVKVAAMVCRQACQPSAYVGWYAANSREPSQARGRYQRRIEGTVFYAGGER